MLTVNVVTYPPQFDEILQTLCGFAATAIDEICELIRTISDYVQLLMEDGC